jgi:hypothetical protein
MLTIASSDPAGESERARIEDVRRQAEAGGVDL